jgi:hypothetical protein
MIIERWLPLLQCVCNLKCHIGLPWVKLCKHFCHYSRTTAASDSSSQEEFSAPGRTRISVTTSSQPNSQNLSSTSINSSDYDSEPLSSSKWTVSLIKNINGLWPTHQAAHRFFPSSQHLIHEPDAIKKQASTTV